MTPPWPRASSSEIRSSGVWGRRERLTTQAMSPSGLVRDLSISSDRTAGAGAGTLPLPKEFGTAVADYAALPVTGPRGLPAAEVFHHHAHMASCLAVGRWPRVRWQGSS